MQIPEHIKIAFVRDKISDKSKWLYVILRDAMNPRFPQGWFGCSMRKQRELSGFSFATIREGICELSEKNIIYVRTQAGCFRTRHEYRINVLYGLDEPQNVYSPNLSAESKAEIERLRKLLLGEKRPKNTDEEHRLLVMRLRKERLIIANSQCEICGSPNTLVLHHLNYQQWGFEKVGDMKILCSLCHGLVHSSKKLTV